MSLENNVQIKISNLVKSFVHANIEEVILKNFNLEIKQGKITTILGPSGSGKTTLLNILSGLDTFTSGSVIIDNELELANLSTRQLSDYRLEKLGFIFQKYNLISDLSVFENVKIAADLKSNSKDIAQTLELVGLGKDIHKKPGELSGGMQQRVAIARALVTNPEILICDEPTGALDEKTGKEILSLIKKLNQEMNTTIILVTHNPGIKDMCDVVVNLNSGVIDKVTINENPINPEDIVWG